MMSVSQRGAFGRSDCGTTHLLNPVDAHEPRGWSSLTLETAGVPFDGSSASSPRR